ncbi:MAG: FecR domain-containing protein, partial [Alphaproteobacteria bacterium]|nr:FecR domain-containing protein [Alphaproteobacteria bacterium]
MLRRFGFLAVVLCLLAAPARAEAQIVQPPVPQETAAKDGRIGTVLDVEGSAAITPVGGMPAAVTVNMPVYLNDIVQTGADARVFILFIDNTNVVLSANALLKIDKYVYDPDDDTSANNNAAYTIEGAFEYVSGLIGHRANPDVQVNTPVGSIGIRGTDFWGGPADGQYDVVVAEGQVSLKTDGGEQLVNKGEGTSVLNRFSRPAPAAVWSAARLNRLAATVRLAHYADALRRMQAIQSRQPEFRQTYGAYVRRAHPQWLHNIAARRAADG